MSWSSTVRAARERVPDDAVAGAWRALNYLVAAQLYLQDNVLLARPLRAADVKERPSGHWGTCPSVNAALAMLGPLNPHVCPEASLDIVHGAGHAGVSALAYAYLDGSLGRVWPEFEPSADGLRRLVVGFPHTATVGSEVSPLIPGHRYMGGQLGPALAFACGTVLDAPGRLVVPLVGDGECETGAASAAWLGVRAFRSGNHGCVLPIVLLNGFRMGSPSLLTRLARDEQVAYFTGLGWAPIFADGENVSRWRDALEEAIERVHPLGEDGPHPVLILTVPKGATGPDRVGERQLLGTPAVHKAPLRDPRQDPAELRALASWLESYGPADLLTPDGAPTRLVAAAIAPPRELVSEARRPKESHGATEAAAARGLDLGRATRAILRRHASDGDFRVFSPDELSSNRISLGDSLGEPPSWVTEILNEELCHLWLQGYVETGRRGVLISYEAFAVINASLVQQQLKQRSLRRARHLAPLPSVNYVLTSLGWNNTYSHQNPSFVSVLLDCGDETVHVLGPADAPRAAANLDAMLHGHGRCNVLVASKHPVTEHPLETLSEELDAGAAIWPHVSDDGDPDVTFAAFGDIAARESVAALKLLREARPELRLRYVHINDLTVLADPSERPLALRDSEFARLFGRGCPVVLAVPCFAGAVRGLIHTRTHAARRIVVRGYRDPGGPISNEALLAHSGIDRGSVARLGDSLAVTSDAPRRQRIVADSRSAGASPS